jgi:hypothetical protein
VREDQIVSAIDTEIDAIFQQRRVALNRWMLNLPMKDRRRRWGEYLAQICQLDKDVAREIEEAGDNRIRLKSKRTPA